MRRLSATERALWARVAASVRVYAPEKKEGVPPPAPPARAGGVTALPTLKSPSPRLRSGVASDRSAPSNTLDGSWDRRLARGAVAPERTVDLHGHALAAAHSRLEAALADAVRDGVRVLLVVTGRPPRQGTSRLDMPMRGIIRASIGDWLAASPLGRRIAAIRPAHPRHGGSGAIYVIFRR